MNQVDILSKEHIKQAFVEDQILRKSFGVENKHYFLKSFALIWGIWVVTLLVTPLPEQLILNQIGGSLSILGSILCALIDYFDTKTRVETTATRVWRILENNKKMEIKYTETGATIDHKSFKAKCTQNTALRLHAMLTNEAVLESVMQPSHTTPENSKEQDKEQDKEGFKDNPLRAKT